MDELEPTQTAWQRRPVIEDAWFRLTLVGLAPKLWRPMATLKLEDSRTGAEITVGVAVRAANPSTIVAEREVRVSFPSGRTTVLEALEKRYVDGRMCLYLACPVCSRCCLNLYIIDPGGSPLACRRCLGMSYAVQNSASFRLTWREERMSLRLFKTPCPKKPAGMSFRSVQADTIRSR